MIKLSDIPPPDVDLLAVGYYDYIEPGRFLIGPEIHAAICANPGLVDLVFECAIDDEKDCLALCNWELYLMGLGITSFMDFIIENVPEEEDLFKKELWPALVESLTPKKETGWFESWGDEDESEA